MSVSKKSSFKGSNGGSTFECEGKGVPQFGGKHTEGPVSSEVKSSTRDSQKHSDQLTGGTWEINRGVRGHRCIKETNHEWLVYKQEYLETDSDPHWRPVERC